MKNVSYRLTAAAFVLVMTATWTQDASPAQPPGNAARGKVVYERYCLSCHGENGDGRGEAGDWIFPKPRDFRQGMFKWRSTPSGTLPTVADLEKTINDGLYGTHMPSWYAIGRLNRLDAISYIQTFSPRWSSEEIPAPITIPPQPAKTPQSIQAGKALYDKLECAKCHGDTGIGDGPSSHEQRNDWGDPITPTDLTAGHFKCGGTPADIYRVFMTGLNGTPMPSYVDSIKPDEAWQLVHYIESLNTTKKPPQFGAEGRPIR
jgi:mono/diheme cytochrome c family protein